MKGVDFPHVVRTPVVLTDEGNPTNFHRLRTTEAAPGVKIGDELLDDRVSEETATHMLVTTITLEPKP